MTIGIQHEKPRQPATCSTDVLAATDPIGVRAHARAVCARIAGHHLTGAPLQREIVAVYLPRPEHTTHSTQHTRCVQHAYNMRQRATRNATQSHAIYYMQHRRAAALMADVPSAVLGVPSGGHWHVLLGDPDHGPSPGADMAALSPNLGRRCDRDEPHQVPMTTATLPLRQYH